MHSIIQSGLVPKGKSNRRDRQSVFFTAVNPMDVQPDRREVQYNLDKPRRIAPYKKTWRFHHNTLCWCNFKLAQRKGLRNYSSRHTTSDLYQQSGFHANKGRTLLQKIRVTQVTLRNTRAELATRSEGCTCSESGISDDRENEVHQHRETCGSDQCVDLRILGIPHSAVEQVETNRKEKVRRFIEQFEHHPNKNMLLKDFEKSEEINHLSQESKDLIT